MSALRVAVAAGVGLVFGAGLALGGMTDPRIVLAFLDVAGAWDARLLVVMAAALAVSAVGVAIARRRGAPLLAERLDLPTRRDLDPSLLAGAACFGVGWGLAGYCPGPGIASLLLNPAEAMWFVAAMVVGARLARFAPDARR